MLDSSQCDLDDVFAYLQFEGVIALVSLSSVGWTAATSDAA